MRWGRLPFTSLAFWSNRRPLVSPGVRLQCGSCGGITVNTGFRTARCAACGGVALAEVTFDRGRPEVGRDRPFAPGETGRNV